MSSIYYKSTRGKANQVTSYEAILRGIAEDGGLYVPTSIPVIDKGLEELSNLSYQELALYIMKKFLPEFTEEELSCAIHHAYDHQFDTTEIAPTIKKGNVYFLELYHGPTLAFKDMALTILPYLMVLSAKKQKLNKEIVILTATSGDTGKAALEGFKDVEQTKVVVFYPQNGVSPIQQRQMITQEGTNTYVFGIDGNFDDAQQGVKEIFQDEELKKCIEEKNYMLSSANSINIGRLVPQIVYYFYTYLTLLRKGEIVLGEKINIAVPTGNFGNILAAYYGKKMGLPVNQLICASNENNVLYDFITTGIYDGRRDLKLTKSPSMDILVSSNVERLLYDISGQDTNKIDEMMEQLKHAGVYEIPNAMKEAFNGWYAGFSNEEEMNKAMEDMYGQWNYIMDTHTAVAYAVYEKYREKTQDPTKTIIASTASPLKFPRSVCEAISLDSQEYNDFQLVYKLAKVMGSDVPKAIEGIEDRPITQGSECAKHEMKSIIGKILG